MYVRKGILWQLIYFHGFLSYFHAAPPYKQVLLSQQIQIYTCLDECSPMKFCLIYRLARLGSRSIDRLINITLEFPLSQKA